MITDPVRLADNAMAFLHDCHDGQMPSSEEGLSAVAKITAPDGKVHNIECIWGVFANNHHIVQIERGKKVLMSVSLFGLNVNELRPDCPLIEQVLHRVNIFDQGEWCGVFLAAMSVLAEKRRSAP